MRITGTWMAIFGGLQFPFVLSFKAAGPCFACFCVLKRALACLSVLKRANFSHKFILYSLSQSERWTAGSKERSSTFEHVRARSRTQKHAIARNSSYDEQTENLEPQYYGSSVPERFYHNLQYLYMDPVR